MSNSYKITKGSSILLDLIRGITAQLVVVGHGISFFGIWTFLKPPQFPYMQNIAVLVFFILSGLLITYSTLRKVNRIEGYGFGHFFIDRFSRIYTAFIPALIFVFILDYISIFISGSAYLYHSNFNFGTFVGNLFMLQDFPFLKHFSKEITSFGSARPFWTLAVEWWIYLFFGFLLLVILRKKRKISTILILPILSVVPFYNLVAGRGSGLFLFWIFGAVVYLFLEYNLLGAVNKRVKQILLLVILTTACIRITLTMKEYEAIFAFLLAIALLLSIDLSKNWNVKKSIEKVIRFHANYSYTLYLIHYSILSFLFVHYKGYNPFLLFFLGFIISNILSVIIGYFSEMYLTVKVKKRLYYKFIKAREIGATK